MAIAFVTAGILIGILITAVFMLILAVTLLIKVFLIGIIALCLIKLARKLLNFIQSPTFGSIISSSFSLFSGLAVGIAMSLILWNIELQSVNSFHQERPIRNSISVITLEPVIQKLNKKVQNLNDKLQTRFPSEVEKRILGQTEITNQVDSDKQVELTGKPLANTSVLMKLSSGPCQTQEKARRELNQKVIETLLALEFSRSGKTLNFIPADPLKTLNLKPDYEVQYKEVGGDNYPIYTATVSLDPESNLVQHLIVQENQRMARNRFETLLFGSTILVLGLGIWRKMI
jgi:hypothetical protein